MKAKLTVESGLDAGTEFELLADRPTVIGRAPYADLKISDIHASKTHCHIVLADQRWTITDLNSSNGTYVNDRRVKSLALSDGDAVRLGRTLLRFSLILEPAAPATAPAKSSGGLFDLLARAEEPVKAAESSAAATAEPATPVPSKSEASPDPAPQAEREAEPAPGAAPSQQSATPPELKKPTPEQPLAEPAEAKELFSLIKDKLKRRRE